MLVHLSPIAESLDHLLLVTIVKEGLSFRVYDNLTKRKSFLDRYGGTCL